MTRPEEHDVSRENQPVTSRPTGMQQFFTKKDKFEVCLEGLALSPEEKERLKRAVEFGFVAGQQTIIYDIVDGDERNAERMRDFYEGILRRIKTGSYVPDTQLESD